MRTNPSLLCLNECLKRGKWAEVSYRVLRCGVGDFKRSLARWSIDWDWAEFYDIINLDWRTQWGQPWWSSLSLNDLSFHKGELLLGLRLHLLYNESLAGKYAAEAFAVIYTSTGMSLSDSFQRVQFDRVKQTSTMIQAKGEGNLTDSQILYLVSQLGYVFPCSKAKFQSLSIQLVLLVY